MPVPSAVSPYRTSAVCRRVRDIILLLLGHFVMLGLRRSQGEKERECHWLTDFPKTLHSDARCVEVDRLHQAPFEPGHTPDVNTENRIGYTTSVAKRRLDDILRSAACLPTPRVA